MPQPSALEIGAKMAPALDKWAVAALKGTEHVVGTSPSTVIAVVLLE